MLYSPATRLHSLEYKKRDFNTDTSCLEYHHRRPVFTQFHRFVIFQRVFMKYPDSRCADESSMSPTAIPNTRCTGRLNYSQKTSWKETRVVFQPANVHLQHFHWQSKSWHLSSRVYNTNNRLYLLLSGTDKNLWHASCEDIGCSAVINLVAIKVARGTTPRCRQWQRCNLVSFCGFNTSC